MWLLHNASAFLHVHADGEVCCAISEVLGKLYIENIRFDNFHLLLAFLAVILLEPRKSFLLITRESSHHEFQWATFFATLKLHGLCIDIYLKRHHVLIFE